jgi:hypothetical protein
MEHFMTGELATKKGACGEYERLLEASHRAMRTWNERRTAIYESGATGRAVDFELLNEQARYAKANAQLQRHIRECQCCQFESKLDSKEAEAVRASAAIAGARA